MRGTAVPVLIAILTFSGAVLSLGPTEGATMPDDLESPLTSRLSGDLDEVLSSGTDMVSLIVQFRDGPTDGDREFVEDIGFSVRRTFTVVPAISVEGHPDLIARLLDNDRVKYVENNDPVVHDM